jgi:hypothetical protein
MSQPLRGFIGSVLAVLTIGQAEVGAAEFEKFLPDKTEIVVGINVKQFLEAPAVKKHAALLMKHHWINLLQLANQDDPALVKFHERQRKRFDDVARNQQLIDGIGGVLGHFIIALPEGANDDDMLMIFKGQFGAARVKEIMKIIVDSKLLPGMDLKIDKVGKHELYTFTIPGAKDAYYAAAVDDQHILAALNKDVLTDSLARTDRAKKPKLKKEIRALLDKVDTKKTLWAAGIDQSDRFHLEVHVAGGIKGKLIAYGENAEDAKDLSQDLKNGLDDMRAVLRDFAKNRKEFAPLVPLVEKIAVTIEGNNVVATGEVPAEMFERLLKALTKEEK